MTTNFFSPLSFVAVFGSGMGKNQDPGSGINIPDPQHWLLRKFFVTYNFNLIRVRVNHESIHVKSTVCTGTQVKKGNFQGILSNYPELGPEPQFVFAGPLRI
jgi:hypothetical protein